MPKSSNRKPKILVVGFAGEGGMAHYAHGLAQAMASKCSTTLMLVANNEITTNFDFDYEFKPIPNSTSSNPIVRRIRFLLQLLSIYIHTVWSKYDVVHFSAIYSIKYYHWLFSLLNLHRCKVVFTVHDVLSHTGCQKTFRNLLQKYISKSESIIVHSQSQKNELVRLYECPEAKVFIVPHGNFNFFLGLSKDKRVAKFRVENLPTASFTVLLFGQIYEYKGIVAFLEAAKLLRDESIRFIIAGKFSPECEPYLETSKQLENVIVFNRYMDLFETVALFEQVDLVAMPYLDSGDQRFVSQSGVTRLACAFSKPTIVSNIEAFAGVVIDGLNGQICNTANTREFATAIKQLSNRPEFCKRLGEGASSFSSKEFSWDLISDLHLLAYKSGNDTPVDL